MTKKIERSRVEAGKAELPKKVSFLTAEKVDYLFVFDRDGELSVEVPAAALAKLAKARGELKVLKGAQKQTDAAAVAALAAEKEAHAATQAALAKAERRIKALEKKLAAGTETAAAPAFAVTDSAVAPAPAPEEKQGPRKSAKSIVTTKARAPKRKKDAAPAADVASGSALPEPEPQPAPTTSGADTTAAPVDVVTSAEN
jgi:hypothetical protein